MNKMTIWQRLNTAQILLIALLLAGVGLALWVEEARSGATQRSAQLVNARDRIQNDLVILSDALRGNLLDPKSEAERRRRQDARIDLLGHLDDIQREYTAHPDLTSAVKNLREFVLGTFGNFQTRVMELAESEPSNAISFYLKNFAPVIQQREQFLKELSLQVDRIQSFQAQRAQTIAIVGLGLIVAVLLASLIVGRFQSSSVTQPLNRLVTSLERMRLGDFTQRLDVDRKDEFGILGDGLNRVADDLSQLVGQVQRSGIQVNSTATQIAATAKQQQATVHEIAATSMEIGATSMEISATSKELVKTMNEVNSVAEETTSLAGSGQASISRMETTMRQIMDASGAVTAKLSVLSEKTANINTVVTTITKVADQTNLLSLNAAIEAEKAGEYGLGFAVVALEIRRLADQTAVATYDIERMVREMQSAVATGVMGMDKFSEDLRRGVEEVRQVSTHLAQIIHQVQTLTPRFQTVNNGMHAQATGAEQISETLHQLSEAAQQTAESLRQSNTAIDQLNGAARELQASVARFHLAT